MVEGRDAKTQVKQHVQDFQERTKDCCSNAVGHKSENIDVDCEAVKMHL